MINNDYKYVGSSNHIKARFGDKQGNPFKGPLKMRFTSRNILAVLSCKDSSISVQNLRGSIDIVYHSVSNKAATDKRMQERQEEKERDRDMWQSKFLAKDTNEKDSTEPTAYSYVNSIPTDLAPMPGTSSVLLADSGFCLRLLNLEEARVSESFGRFGAEPENFSAPTAVDCLRVGQDLVLFSCDAASNQRLQVFDESFRLLASAGGLGPLPGQFRDPVSVTSHLPQEFSHYSLSAAQHGHQQQEGADSLGLRSGRHTPAWFRGGASLEQLEAEIYDDDFRGNFLVSRYSGVEPQGALADTHAAPAFDMLCVTQARALKHWVVSRELQGARQYFISNQVGEAVRHGSLWELVRHQRRLVLGADPRPHALVAVVDRRNFRVQVFRFHWTASELYRPGLEVAAVVGGAKNRFVELLDPVAAAYSPSGDLAICDSGAKCVVLLSTHFDVVKRISLAYVSPAEQRMLGRGVKAAGPSHQAAPKKSETPAAESVAADAANNKPCCVAFNATGNLAVGYRNGGVYVLEACRSYEVGAFDRLQSMMLERIILRYLGYEEVAALRDCCMCLHNCTRELRLSWRVFGSDRARYLQRAVYLFVRWARVGEEGAQTIDRTALRLADAAGRAVCERHLDMQCPCRAEQCAQSHGALVFDVEEVCAQGAYLEHADLQFCVSALFGAAFVWRLGRYVDALFQAFAEERVVLQRHDAMTRRNEVVRETAPAEVRALSFRRYLELLTVLEEERSGAKEVHAHRLFRRSARSRFVPDCPTTLEEVDKRIVPDHTEQYLSRGIDVPFKATKGPHFVTRSGMESAHRLQPDAIKAHVETFQLHAEQAASRINKLFS